MSGGTAVNDQPKPLAVAWSIARARARCESPDRPVTASSERKTSPRFSLDSDRTESMCSLLSGRLSPGSGIGWRRSTPTRCLPMGRLPSGSTFTTQGLWPLPPTHSPQARQPSFVSPGAFDTPWAMVGGESLSLNDMEHGKIRRFQDPRIHAALVCGSVSCPSLRYEPFGDNLGEQLDEQIRTFLAGGGAHVDRDSGTLQLSRVFLWYGGDFVRPGRMPTWIPARRRDLRGRSPSGCQTRMPRG